jgi:hypothetical protein
MKLMVGFALAMGMVVAQQPAAPASAAQAAHKETKVRLALVATRAIANFHSADSIAASLASRGQTLHPQITALRSQIEATLDQAQEDFDRGDDSGANKALDRAQVLVDRFAKRLGGS